MEPQRARSLFHHCYICLECGRKHFCFHRTGPVLRLAAERDYRCLECHLNRSIWLWHLRHRSPDLRLACRIRVLEQSSHGQDPPGIALARPEEFQATTCLLVQLHRHGCL